MLVLFFQILEHSLRLPLNSFLTLVCFYSFLLFLLIAPYFFSVAPYLYIHIMLHVWRRHLLLGGLKCGSKDLFCVSQGQIQAGIEKELQTYWKEEERNANVYFVRIQTAGNRYKCACCEDVPLHPLFFFLQDACHVYIKGTPPSSLCRRRFQTGTQASPAQLHIHTSSGQVRPLTITTTSLFRCSVQNNAEY